MICAGGGGAIEPATLDVPNPESEGGTIASGGMPAIAGALTGDRFINIIRPPIRATTPPITQTQIPMPSETLKMLSMTLGSNPIDARAGPTLSFASAITSSFWVMS